MHAWRPCDAVESAVSWKSAIERFDGPSALIFSRQGLPHQERTTAQVADIAKGAYILKDSINAKTGTPDAILIATGSEVGLAMDAAKELAAKGKNIRVVSMPCAEIFCKQDAAYIESVLPASVAARVAVEALHKDYWYKFVGLNGAIVGMDTFGESAPIADLMKHFGFTVEKVVAAVEGVL
jgi:transketolase